MSVPIHGASKVRLEPYNMWARSLEWATRQL